jgi:hypothetical protein
MTIDQTKLQSSDAAPASMLGHIFGSHIERIGVTRTLAGGLSMYLCIPLLIVGHLTLAVGVVPVDLAAATGHRAHPVEGLCNH